MLTLLQASNALKDYYLGVITSQLNTKINPLLAKIKQTTENVLGRDVVKLVGYGINGGIGTGDETAELPKAAENRYTRLTVTLKNLYGRIELTDKAVRASRQSSGAFVDLLNSEMEGLLEAASLNLSRMLYGDGSGLLGKVVSVESVGSEKHFILDSVKKFVEGIIVRTCPDNSGLTAGLSNLRVRIVDRADKRICFDGTPALVASLAAGHCIFSPGGVNQELTGLEKIFSDSTMIYNTSRTAFPFLLANVDNTTTDITESAIQSKIDNVEESTGDPINFIACSYGVKRALQNHLATYRRNIDTMDLAGGFRALSYNGIPVVADRFCREKTMYLLNTDYLGLYQLCDWEWLEGENGTVLKQIANTATYSATLVKYAELLCDKIRAQAAMTNLTEA